MSGATSPVTALRVSSDTQPCLAVTARTLAGTLLALFTLDNLLLPAFLGAPVLPLTFGVLPVAALAGWLLARAGGLEARIPHATFLAVFGVALAIFVLGGEGRLVYANPDWQVRDAVLADLASNPWPFAYEIGGWRAVLRAPLGLYLLPALASGWHDVALLLSNTLRLALILALAGTLFDSRRARLIGLGVFVAFSGWDVVGNALMSVIDGPMPWDHIEQWNPGSQYSSTLTLAFWVPNHAMAGWACALTYLLWLRRKAPIGLLGAIIPLTALWSPLAAMGALPFALHAGIRALRERAWTYYDIGLTMLATTVALPSLWYLQLDPGSVSFGWWPLAPLPMALLVALEIAPLALPVFLFKRTRPNERTMLFLVSISLLFMPMFHIGTGIDFQMRASIMPLTLLTFAFAEWIVDLRDEQRTEAPRRLGLQVLGIVTVAIGAVTPAMEVRRALDNDPSPRPLCSLGGAWKAQINNLTPFGTYLAQRSSLPSWMAHAPITAGRSDPANCWATSWVEVNQH